MKNPNLRHRQARSQNKGLSRALLPLEIGRRGQPEPEGGSHGPREALSTELQAGFIASQDFLGFWTVNIHLRTCASCTFRVAGSGEVISHSDCACQTPGHLRCSVLGRAQNAGPTESAPLRSTLVLEPECLRPGKCIQPRASLRQFLAEQPRA